MLLQNGWATSMGGILQCFATDDCGKPTIPVKSIIPHNNSFVFFKVGKETFHKVDKK